MTETKPDNYLECIDPISNATYSFNIDGLIKMTNGEFDVEPLSSQDIEAFVAIMASFALEHGREPQPIG
tara:strand:+ start:521 stop:727 length:207 start_codon:yes stop_codon:yes gene_type:complete